MDAATHSADNPVSARWALTAPRYELIPIKGMLEQAEALPAGATVTVTCSPKHGLERTLASAEVLQAQGFGVIPHIAARLVQDEGHLREILQRVRAADMHEVFVVGGDASAPVGTFRDGLSLMKVLGDSPDRPACVGFPAYPQGHATIPYGTLWQAMREKVRLGDCMVTQICFDSEPVLTWLQAIRTAGIQTPAYVGLAGVVEMKRLVNIAMQIGVGLSSRLMRRQGGMVRRLLSARQYRPDGLVTDIAAAMEDPGLGIHGFHINTFNNVAPTVAWRDDFLPTLPVPERINDTAAAAEAPALDQSV